MDEMLSLLSKDPFLMSRKHSSFLLSMIIAITWMVPSHLRSQGGVKLVSGTGRITLDNTIEERLRLLEDKVR